MRCASLRRTIQPRQRGHANWRACGPLCGSASAFIRIRRDSSADAKQRSSRWCARVIVSIPEARALGEIGLDYHYDFAPKDVQQEVFRLQIRLAREIDLPIIIHTREAEDDTLAILREESRGPVRGVMHCFTGTRRLAEEALALGMHISFAGIVTFPKGANVREVAALVPADRLLCETDSPYLAPTPHRGKRNEPAWVVRVAEELSALRRVPVDELREQTQRQFSTRSFDRKLKHCRSLFVDTPSLNMVRSSGFEER